MKIYILRNRLLSASLIWTYMFFVFTHWFFSTRRFNSNIFLFHAHIWFLSARLFVSHTRPLCSFVLVPVFTRFVHFLTWMLPNKVRDQWIFSEGVMWRPTGTFLSWDSWNMHGCLNKTFDCHPIHDRFFLFDTIQAKKAASVYDTSRHFHSSHTISIHRGVHSKITHLLAHPLPVSKVHRRSLGPSYQARANERSYRCQFPRQRPAAWVCACADETLRHAEWRTDP